MSSSSKIKSPGENEIRAKLINPHMHHLVARAKGQKTIIDKDRGIATVVTGEDWYCFTCREWVALYGVKFDTTPKSNRKACWIGSPPPEIKKKYKEMEELRPLLLAEKARIDFEALIKKMRKLRLTDGEIRDAFEGALERTE